MKTIKTVMGAALLGLTVSALAAPAEMGKGNDSMAPCGNGMMGMGAGRMMGNCEGPVTMPMLRQHMGMMREQMQGMPMAGDPEARREYMEGMIKQMQQHMDMMQKYLDETEGQTDKPAKE